MNMTTFQFKVHSAGYDGYCKRCDAVTREGGTEPDAEDYTCDECGHESCVGMDFALLREYIQIVE